MNLSEICAELEEHLELLKGYIGRSIPVNDGQYLTPVNTVQQLANLSEVLAIVTRKHIALLVEHGKLIIARVPQCESSDIQVRGNFVVFSHFEGLQRRAKEMLP